MENKKYKARDFILEYKYKRTNTKEITTIQVMLKSLAINKNNDGAKSIWKKTVIEL